MGTLLSTTVQPRTRSSTKQRRLPPPPRRPLFPVATSLYDGVKPQRDLRKMRATIRMYDISLGAWYKYNIGFFLVLSFYRVHLPRRFPSPVTRPRKSPAHTVSRHPQRCTPTPYPGHRIAPTPPTRRTPCPQPTASTPLCSPSQGSSSSALCRTEASGRG